jgi:serine/threonine protein phosphatase 1
MIGIFKKILGGETRYRGKAGCRAYAVGDIHGRLDLLDELLARIEQELKVKPVRDAYLVFLGDLIDRGPDSAGVVERLRGYRPPPGVRTIFLMGNHEEVMLRVIGGEKGLLENWLVWGGAECVRSYGIDPGHLGRLAEDEAIALLRRKVPVEHRSFLNKFADTFTFGDYLFVHAGILPGRPLDEQEKRDLRWIREPFLNDDKEHGFLVVHGHTIVEEVEERRNRIGIDTGAYRTGNLSALAIEEEERWYLSTAAAGSARAAA